MQETLDPPIDGPSTVFVSGCFPLLACLDIPTLSLKGELTTGIHPSNDRVATLKTLDGDWLIAVSQHIPSGRFLESSVSLFSLDSDSPNVMLPGHSGTIPTLAFVQSTGNWDFPRIVSGERSRNPAIWNAVSGKQLYRFAIPSPGAGWNGIAESFPKWNPHLVLLGGQAKGWQWPSPRQESGYLYEFNAELEGKPVGEYRGHGRTVEGVGVDLSRKILFSSSVDRTSKVWSLDSRECLQSFGLSNQSYALHYDEDRSLLLVAMYGFIEYRDVRNFRVLIRVKVTKGIVHDLCQMGSGAYVAAAASQDDLHNLTFLDSSGKVKKALTLGGWCLGCSTFENDGIMETACLAEWQRVTFVGEMVSVRVNVVLVNISLALPFLVCLGE